MTMRNNRSRDAKILSRLSSLSTEELKQYLEKAILSEDVSDDQIKLLMDILEEREKESAQGAPVEAKSREELEQAWNRFLDTRGIEVEAAEEVSPAVAEAETPAGKKRVPAFQIAAAACACVVLLAVFAPGAQAGRLLAKWLPDYFWFVDAGGDGATFDRDASDETEFDTVEAALAAYHITEPLVPTWLPDGYELEMINVVKEDLDVQFDFKYHCDEEAVTVNILAYDNVVDANNRTLKNVQNPETVSINGIDHFIFENDHRWTAMWTHQCYECCIAGVFSSDDLKHMLKSIYE